VPLDTRIDDSPDTRLGLGAAIESTWEAKLGLNELKLGLADGYGGEAVGRETKGKHLGLTFGLGTEPNGDALGTMMGSTEGQEYTTRELGSDGKELGPNDLQLGLGDGSGGEAVYLDPKGTPVGMAFGLGTEPNGAALGTMMGAT
jgi:hypothetical protein